MEKLMRTIAVGGGLCLTALALLIMGGGVDGGLSIRMLTYVAGFGVAGAILTLLAVSVRRPEDD